MKLDEKTKINTYLGHCFSPLEATESDIEIGDIAHALSFLCRANGHFKRFYSVAQHSVNCALEGLAREYGDRVALMLLLHDASEAYISDITRPLKLSLPNYRVIEDNLQNVIYKKYGIVPTEAEKKQIAEVDDTFLYCEFAEMADAKVFATERTTKITADYTEKHFSTVENDFLNLFDALTDSLGINA